MKIGGALSPAMKTTDLMLNKIFEEPKKQSAAKERRNREITERIPLELLGNTGFIPLYKDVRKVLLADIYKDLRKSDNKKGGKPVSIKSKKKAKGGFGSASFGKEVSSRKSSSKKGFGSAGFGKGK